MACHRQPMSGSCPDSPAIKQPFYHYGGYPLPHCEHKTMITFRQATHSDALFIAQGFHTAMLMDDTPESRIRLFAEKICMRDDVLYSAPNTTIVEVDASRQA